MALLAFSLESITFTITVRTLYFDMTVTHVWCLEQHNYSILTIIEVYVIYVIIYTIIEVYLIYVYPCPDRYH